MVQSITTGADSRGLVLGKTGTPSSKFNMAFVLSGSKQLFVEQSLCRDLPTFTLSIWLCLGVENLLGDEPKSSLPFSLAHSYTSRGWTPFNSTY